MTFFTILGGSLLADRRVKQRTKDTGPLSYPKRSRF